MEVTGSASRDRHTGPRIYMAPLIDIIFLLLIFFMSASIFYQLESEIGITVPSAEETRRKPRSPGEVIINIRADGSFVVNQRELDQPQLMNMLERISAIYEEQPVIIRADRKTYHEDVIRVLDMCASAGIWNISFAVITEREGE